MKNLTVLFSLILLLLGVLGHSWAYRCGTPQLSFRPFPITGNEDTGREGWKDGTQDIQSYPTAPALPAAPALAIGTERTFFVPDFRSMQQYTVSAVLRAIGSFCYIFVEEAEWNTRVTAETVASIVHAFDVATPANRQYGIYTTLTGLFGAPPDIDENGRVILLLLNIRDANRAGQYTAGFFNPADQSRGVLRKPGFRGFPIRSNEADMLYIDTQPLNPNAEIAHQVIAHELLHLIHWRHDPHEATWVDEGCAGYASFLCGYSASEHVTAFEKTPSVSLIAWPETDADALPHYGAAFIFMLYLHEQYGGVETLTEIVQNRGTSLTGLTDALALRGITQKVPDIFIEWKLANYLSEYRGVSLSLSPRRWHNTYPSGTQGAKLSNFSADYIGFSDAGGLTLGFSSNSGANSAAHVIEFHGASDVRIREIKLDTANSGAVMLPNTVREALLVPSLQTAAISINADTHSANYEYSAVRGAHITFITTALPNPVHPRSWDIIAQPSEDLVGLTPTVTLTRFDNKVERIYKEAVAMYPITQEVAGSRLYRLSFLLEPEIAPESIVYQISLDSRIVDTGSLTE